MEFLSSKKVPRHSHSIFYYTGGVAMFLFVVQVCSGILLFMYYFNNPPLIGLEYVMPSEGNYLIVNKTLIEAVTLLVFVFFPTGKFIGLDVFIDRFMKRKIKS